MRWVSSSRLQARTNSEVSVSIAASVQQPLALWAWWAPTVDDTRPAAPSLGGQARTVGLTSCPRSAAAALGLSPAQVPDGRDAALARATRPGQWKRKLSRLS